MADRCCFFDDNSYFCKVKTDEINCNENKDQNYIIDAGGVAVALVDDHPQRL